MENSGAPASSDPPGNVSDEEEYEDEDKLEYSSRVGLVFLIDAQKKMFDGGENSFFHQSIKAIREILLNLGRRRMSNFITGIVAFGTDKSSSQLVPAHVAEIQPLGYPLIEKVKDLNSLLESNFKLILEEYGQSDTFSLASAIQQCQALIKKWKSKLYSKGIVILTCDDDPFAADVGEAHKARKAAEELFDSKIGLDVIPFGKFDPKLFYHELVATARGEDPTDVATIQSFKEASGLIEAVEGFMVRYTRMIRKLVLGEGKEVLVTLFKLYSEPSGFSSAQARTGASIQIPTPTDQPSDIAPVNQVVKVDIPRIRTVERYPCLGGRYLNITRASLEKLSPRVGTGLKVVGFYPTNSIPVHYSVSKTYLLVPFDEDHDSKKLLSCLLYRCTVRDLSILAWFQYSRRTEPSLVALIPNTMDHLVQKNVYPQGFSVVVIPFEDEICDYEEDEEEGESAEPTEDQQEAMGEVVKRLTFPYKPQQFHDFDYRRQVALYEALALDYNAKEEVEDDTDSAVADLEDLPERVLNFNHLRKRVFDEFAEEDEEGPTPKVKRKVSMTLGDIKDVILAKQAESLTIAQLRDYLKYEGVKSLSTKTKPLLVELAYQVSQARNY